MNIEIRWLLEQNLQCKLQRHINQEKDTADKTKQTTRITIEKHRKKKGMGDIQKQQQK